MRFYYNAELNICAEESWVIEYILDNYEDYEDVYDGLRTCREFYGWFECEVSNTIKEKMTQGRYLY